MLFTYWGNKRISEPVALIVVDPREASQADFGTPTPRRPRDMVNGTTSWTCQDDFATWTTTSSPRGPAHRDDDLTTMRTPGRRHRHEDEDMTTIEDEDMTTRRHRQQDITTRTTTRGRRHRQVDEADITSGRSSSSMSAPCGCSLSVRLYARGLRPIIQKLKRINYGGIPCDLVPSSRPQDARDPPLLHSQLRDSM